MSIVIAAHDAAAWLAEAVDSVRAQTLRDIEIIVVDDGSTDTTPALLRDLAAQEPRLRPAWRSRPGGPSVARNQGLRLARGRWIALLDADDAFLPDRLEHLVAIGEAWGADLVADDLLRRGAGLRDELGRHLGAAAIAAAPRPLSLAAFVCRDMPAARPDSARAIGYLKPMLRRSFLERHRLRFDEGVRGGEDFLFYGEAIAAGGRFLLAEAALYVYRVRGGSLSNRPGMAGQHATANRRLARRAAALGLHEALALLGRRQLDLDRAALAEAARDGAWLRALSFAAWQHPGRLARDLRIVAGAARRGGRG